MTVVIDRLEHALQLWESLCFRLSVARQRRVGLGLPALLPPDPVFRSFAVYRQELLNARENKPVAWERFIASLETMKYMAGMVNFPLELWCWTVASRRIFSLSDELSALLEATTLDGVMIGEIAWPFPAFAIDLPTPLVDHRGREYDCILVSRYQYNEPGESEPLIRPQIVVRLIARDVGEAPIIAPFERQKVLRLLRMRRWEDAHAVCTGDFERYQGQSWTNYLVLDDEAIQKAPLSESVQDLVHRTRPDAPMLSEQEMPLLQSAFRIAMGTCLYLSTLPPKESDRMRWDRLPRKGNPDPKAIADKALVCAVRNIHALSTEERDAIVHGKGVPGTERCAHFRRGHWRRLPTADADAMPRRTWVRPCLVRADRLGPGTVPGGSQSGIV